MWLLPMSLRAKMAVVVLLGIFFVPFATSDLRGLTHILTCQSEVTTSLYIADDDVESVRLSADAPVVAAEDDDGPIGLCDGLVADLQLVGAIGERAAVFVSITNNSAHDWKGSVEIRFDDTPVPVAIGSIDRGATETDTVEIRVGTGNDFEIDGTLRIGL